MPDPKTYKQHFEAKHPKNTMPEELKDIQTWKLCWILMCSHHSSSSCSCYLVVLPLMS